MFDKKVLEISGLDFAGIDDEGNELFNGTVQQWEKATKLQAKVDQLTEDEVDELLNEEIDER